MKKIRKFTKVVLIILMLGCTIVTFENGGSDDNDLIVSNVLTCNDIYTI